MDANLMTQDLAQRVQDCETHIEQAVTMYPHVAAIGEVETAERTDSRLFARIGGWLRNRFAARPKPAAHRRTAKPVSAFVK